jgi:phosphatidylinositol 4-kinase
MWALMSELSSDAILADFSTFNCSAPALRPPSTLAIDPAAFCGRGVLRVHEVRAFFRSDLRWESRLFLVRDMLLAALSQDSCAFLIAEVDFFARLTAVSGRLQPVRKEERLSELSKMLAGLTMPVPPAKFYLPCDPDALVVDMIKDSCAAMQSHAKAPFLLAFKVLKNGLPAKTACIFKMMDDCRQDRLALQMMRVLQDQFVRANTCCLLLPYVVVTTGPSRGVIQCVPRASSRDALGKTWEGSMYTHFITKFGVETSEGYRRVQRNFIRSLAGYSIASFILQMKDRHNGNILVDEDGHLIHIDFGFLFDISPGGNLKFERAPFKMAPEYIQIMGGSVEAPPFKYFVDLCVQGFIAVRRVAPAIMALASLMQVTFQRTNHNVFALIFLKDCGLPSYKPMTLSNLKSRFLLEKDDADAALFMQERVKDAVANMVCFFFNVAYGFCVASGHLQRFWQNTTTRLYDEFQRMQNGIDF